MSNDALHEPAGFPEPDPLLLPEPPPGIIPKSNAWRELADVLWLSFPIVITMLSYTAMQFIDVLMVGNHSKSELAAIGPATSSFFLVASFLMGTLSITNTFVAQCVGRGEKRAGPPYVWQALYLSLIWGAVAFFLWPVAPRFFDWAGHAPEIREFETLYTLRDAGLDVPAVGFCHALSAFYQATRRAGIPMVAALVGNTFNVVANYALIFGNWGFPDMGIEGAALATVISSYLQATLMMAVFLGERMHREYRTRRAFAFSPRKFWQLVRVGIPAGATWVLENASWTLFLLKVIGELGEDALAAQNAAMQIIHLSFMPVLGLDVAVQAIVGQHIGMRDYAGAKRRAYRAMGVAVAYMVSMGVLFVVFRSWFIAQFVSSDLSTEAAERVVAMGSTMLIFGAVFQAFDAVGIVSYGGLKGVGDTRYPMVMTVAVAWLVFLPLSVYYTHYLRMGVAGAWLAVTIYVALLGVIYFTRFHSEAWRKIDIFLEASEATTQPGRQPRW